MIKAKHLGMRLLGLLLATMIVAGCDKCGHRVKFNAPTLPGTCGENAEPAH